MSGGFLSLPSLQHANLMHTQYIAPLMADFVAGEDIDAVVFVKSGKDSVTVQWTNVQVRDQERPHS